MDKIALSNKKQRIAVFTEVAEKASITPYIVEKDFWVSWILGKIFTDEELSKILCFKGGTSLSKAFNLIERFSEDIDLILSLKTVLKEGEQVEQSSKTKQAKFNDTIKKRASEYISTDLKNKISKVLSSSCTVKTNKDDFHILHIAFPRIFNDSYIQSEIKLEIGPFALWEPNDKYPLSSFVGKHLPNLNLPKPVVPTIKPECTFWEKITILHHEHYRPEGNTTPPIYSRHYYDIFKIGPKVKEKAFANLGLLKEVVDFKIRFYPQGWARYEEACPRTMCLIPAKHNQKILVEDYSNMKDMIYGEVPTWDDIMDYIKKLEDEINNLD